MVKISGEEKDAAGKTVAAYLEEANYDARSVAVELNEAILPRAKYAQAVLKDGDCIEIVSFMGGGC